MYELLVHVFLSLNERGPLVLLFWWIDVLQIFKYSVTFKELFIGIMSIQKEIVRI
jgi:hypothetical protein